MAELSQTLVNKLRSQLTPESISELKQRHGIASYSTWTRKWRLSPKFNRVDTALMRDALEMVKKQNATGEALVREAESILSQSIEV